MQGINEFIIEIKEPLKKEVELGSKKILVDPTYDQTKYSNRIGKVVSTPLGLDTPIKAGDEVVIVHTVLMTQIYNEKRQESTFLIDKERGYYRLANELIVLFRSNPEEKWRCNDIQLMVKPIKVEKKDFKVGKILLPENFHNTDVECNTHGFVKQYGIIKYMNDDLAKLGVKEGDKVFFSDVGDYEFNLEGEILYCMDNRDVLALA